MIVAADSCPCVGCTSRPVLGKMLCPVHEAMLHGAAYTHYEHTLHFCFASKPRIADYACCLAVLCAALAYREKKISGSQMLAAMKRYEGYTYAEIMLALLADPYTLF